MKKTILETIQLQAGLSKLASSITDSSLLRKLLTNRKAIESGLEVYNELRAQYTKAVEACEQAGVDTKEFDNCSFLQVIVATKDRCNESPELARLHALAGEIHKSFDSEIELDFAPFTLDEIEKAKVPTNIAFQLSDLIEG